jgi:uncharacterized protein with NRDE domain
MCLLVLAWRVHPRYRLVVAANRDEFHERPAAPLAQWSNPPAMIAGRDLRAGGTWLGVEGRHRLGVVTNYRDLQRPEPGAPSRGALIPNYLGQMNGPGAFLKELSAGAKEYSGFNLVLADEHELWYASNRADSFARALQPGVYGLSNHLLDSPWPKLVRVQQRFSALLKQPEIDSATLFDMLADTEPTANDTSIPAGMAPDLARALSAPFVRHQTYGTRCSTVLLAEETGTTRITERRFDPAGNITGEIQRAPNAGSSFGARRE